MNVNADLPNITLWLNIGLGPSGKSQTYFEGPSFPTNKSSPTDVFWGSSCISAVSAEMLTAAGRRKLELINFSSCPPPSRRPIGVSPRTINYGLLPRSDGSSPSLPRRDIWGCQRPKLPPKEIIQSRASGCKTRSAACPSDRGPLGIC